MLPPAHPPSYLPCALCCAGERVPIHAPDPRRPCVRRYDSGGCFYSYTYLTSWISRDTTDTTEYIDSKSSEQIASGFPVDSLRGLHCRHLMDALPCGYSHALRHRCHPCCPSPSVSTTAASTVSDSLQPELFSAAFPDLDLFYRPARAGG